VDSWEAVAASVVVAVLCGFGDLLCLEYLAGFIVYGCLAVPMVASTSFGLYLVALSQGILEPESLGSVSAGSQAVDLSVARHFTTGKDEYDLGLGLLLSAFGVVLCLVCCCCKNSIAAAVGSVEATCDCLQQMPSLLLNPFFTLIGQLAVSLLMLAAEPGVPGGALPHLPTLTAYRTLAAAAVLATLTRLSKCTGRAPCLCLPASWEIA